jgi:polysaccharide biosynthesis/export protein
MKQTLLIACVILAFAVSGVAQQKPPAKNVNPPPQTVGATPQAAIPQKDALPKVPEGFVIGLEDVLQINVWKEQEHSVPQAVVRPDGMITLPMIGDIKADGLTPKQLEEAITAKLEEVLTAPAVTVTVLRIESLKVTIIGNVGKPGVYPLTAPMTVLELIAKAGGLIPDVAHGKNIKIIKKKDGRLLFFNYDEVIHGRSLRMNVFLETGDMVIVP